MAHQKGVMMSKLLDRAANELLLLPEGEYQVVFKDWEPVMFLGKAPKICAEFSVVEMGEFFERLIYRWWNVKPTHKKLTKTKWKVNKSSKLLREYCDVTTRTPRRLDRIPLSDLQDHICLAKVKTVTEGKDQSVIPQSARYSIICNLRRFHG